MCQAASFVACPPGSFVRDLGNLPERSQRRVHTSQTPRSAPCASHRRRGGRAERKARQKRNQDNQGAESSADPPLGPTPGERTGFRGWRKEDDAYWRELHRREKAYRGPSIPQFDPESGSYAPPKNRDGEDIQYPAQVRWDMYAQKLVPTTEEEEEEMRGPSRVLDPFFIEEAAEGEEFRPNLERGDQRTDEPIILESQLFEVQSLFEEPEPTGAETSGNGIGMDAANEIFGIGDGAEPASNGIDVNATKEIFSLANGAVQNLEPEAEPAPTPVSHRGRNGRKVADTKRKRLGLKPGDWRVVHLGTSSAVPTRQRNVSATAFVGVPPGGGAGGEPHMVIVDAGENVEARLLDAMWCMSHGFRWIRAVVITHLHGDHVYGLPGLLRGIGEYCQHRRRAALAGGPPDPVVRVFGPPGTRGFLRSALFWTVPLGVRFSVAELVPRDWDFHHIEGGGGRGGGDDGPPRASAGGIREIDPHGNVTELPHDHPRFHHKVPPPHPDEVRVDDVHAGEDGVWRVWGDCDDEAYGFEVVAAPLKHRVPCFGYVFRGRKRPRAKATVVGHAGGDGAAAGGPAEIDIEKARALGVYGSQFRVLRSGRPVVVKKTGQTVHLADVAAADRRGTRGTDELPVAEEEATEESCGGERKVVILGDTCDSSLIADAARDADVVVHEATFANALARKAAQALHSTAGMAGKFARDIRAKKLVLTHFSSRYEGMMQDAVSTSGEWDLDSDDADGDLHSSSQLVKEAAWHCPKAEVVAAVDFMEHTVRADGETKTRDRPFNRFAVNQAYSAFGGGPEAADAQEGAVEEDECRAHESSAIEEEKAAGEDVGELAEVVLLGE